MNWMIASTEYVGESPRLGPDTTVVVNQLLGYGYSDFTKDSQYDPAKHTIISNYKQKLFPKINVKDWFWNGSSFQDTQP